MATAPRSYISASGRVVNTTRNHSYISASGRVVSEGLIADGAATTPKSLSQSGVGTASLSKALDLLTTPDMGGVGTASLSLIVTHFHAASMVAVGTSTITKLVRKTLSIAATGTSALLKKVSKTLGYSATGTATQDEGIVVDQSASMSTTGTSGLTTLFIAFVAIIDGIVKAIVQNIVQPIVKLITTGS